MKIKQPYTLPIEIWQFSKERITINHIHKSTLYLKVTEFESARAIQEHCTPFTIKVSTSCYSKQNLKNQFAQAHASSTLVMFHLYICSNKAVVLFVKLNTARRCRGLEGKYVCNRSRDCDPLSTDMKSKQSCSLGTMTGAKFLTTAKLCRKKKKL